MPALNRTGKFTFFSDAYDTLTSPIDAVTAAVSKFVKDNVPGAEWVSHATRDTIVFLQSNPGIGIPIIGATVAGMAAAVVTGTVSEAYAALSTVVGPQIATVAFALPGMLTGDAFSQAWAKETAKRMAQTEQIYGGQIAEITGQQLKSMGLDPDLAQKINPDVIQKFKAANPDVKSTADALDKMGLSPESISVFNHGEPPPDVIAMAWNYLAHEMAYNLDDFSLKTRDRPTTVTSVPDSPFDSDAARRIALARRYAAAKAAANSPSISFLAKQKQVRDALAAGRTTDAGVAFATTSVSVPDTRRTWGRQLILVTLLTAPVWATMLALRLPRHSR